MHLSSKVDCKLHLQNVLNSMTSFMTSQQSSICSQFSRSFKIHCYGVENSDCTVGYSTGAGLESLTILNKTSIAANAYYLKQRFQYYKLNNDLIYHSKLSFDLIHWLSPSKSDFCVIFLVFRNLKKWPFQIFR